MVFPGCNRVLWFVCAVCAGGGGLAHAQECTPVLLEQLFDYEPGVQSLFGSFVSISGDTAFVGVFGDVVNGVDSGSVHLFRFDGVSWVFEDRIAPVDGESLDLFGTWLSVDHDSLLVGASRDDDLGEESGSVYAYRRIEGEWVFLQKLHASDGGAGDGFSVVDQENGRAVIGAPGSILGDSPGAMYIFEFDGVAWNEVQKITASDGKPGDSFGISPKLEGDRLVVGAPFDLNELGYESGAVYIFEFDGTQWVGTTKLEPDIVDFDHSFGFELSLIEDTIFVGDYMGSFTGRPGEVAVFEYAGGDWSKTQTLIPELVGDTSGFGSGVILNHDGLMLVGAPFSEQGVGVVFIYRLVDGVWVQSGTIESPSNETDQLFGARMGLAGVTAMIASPRAEENIGIVTVYDLGCQPCRADFTGEGLLNYFDLSAFMSAFASMDSAADIDGNSEFNFVDISEFLGAYSDGCP